MIACRWNWFLGGNVTDLLPTECRYCSVAFSNHEHTEATNFSINQSTLLHGMP